MSQVLVWCLLIDHEKKATFGDVFDVEVPSNTTISSLKKAIKEENSDVLEHVVPRMLTVWKYDKVEFREIAPNSRNQKLDDVFSAQKAVWVGPDQTVEQYSGKTLLIEVPDTATQEIPSGWHSETDEIWRNFYKYWRTQSFDEVFNRPVIPLAYDQIGLDDAGHRLNCFADTNDQLYVRQAYRDMFDRVFEFGRKDFRLGIVISGQPGIGKTMWLWFAVICLIMKKEHVAFHWASTTRLFCNGDVYRTTNAEIPRKDDRIIWTLIDCDVGQTPPAHLVSRGGAKVFPIQASSPNKARYGAWLKQRNGFMWGMSLWSQDELRKGIELHQKYQPTLKLLERALEDSSSAQEPPQEPALLKALEYKEVYHSGPNDQRAKQLLMMVLDEAIKKYGEAPRHVWTAVFSGFGGTEQRIEAALTGLSLHLDNFLESLSRLGESDQTSKNESLSHQIISLEVKSSGQQMMDDDFLPKFRSIEVGERVMARFRVLQFNKAQRLVALYRKLPESSSLAGWIFESIAHERLRSGQSLDYLYIMQERESARKRVEKDPEHISFQFDPRSKPSDMRLPTRERDLVFVDFNDDKFSPTPDLKLEESYCVPNVPNNPLFDSFFVEFGERAEVIVWIFQTTLSSLHGGSERGFVRIRSIIAAAQAHKEALKVRKRKRSSRVEVKYVLLCPASKPGTPESSRTWNLPAKGWKSLSEGPVYCLFVNVDHLNVPFRDN